MGFFVIALLVLPFVGAWWLTERQRSAQCERHLAVAVRALYKMGAVRISGESRIAGEHEGFSYRLELTRRVGDEAVVPHTECRVSEPLGDVFFRLRQRGESPLPDHAFATGDSDFDAAFVVEAAPRAYVERVLSRAIRAELLAARPKEARWSEDGLVVVKPEWPEGLAETRRFVRLALGLARSLALADEQAIPSGVGSARDIGGYRRLDRSEPAPAEVDEVAALKRKVHTQERWFRLSETMGNIIAVSLAAIVLALVYVLALHRL